jgi:hypothetical protein
MVEDLSALDAELDRLGVESAADPTALASSYAGQLGALSEIDQALNALATGLDTELPSPARAFTIPPPRSARPPDPDSAEIALPVQVRAADDEQSGELPLDEVEVPRSGAFALPPDTIGPSGEPVTEDLTFETDLEDLVELDDAERAAFEPGRISETDRRVDAEFAELFSDPSGDLPLSAYEDDTEIFDASALAAIKAKGELEPIENAFNAEELDSAEFEIVMDASEERAHESATSAIPPLTSGSTPPEKRPSFLGRLFGRKDE